MIRSIVEAQANRAGDAESAGSQWPREAAMLLGYKEAELTHLDPYIILIREQESGGHL